MAGNGERNLGHCGAAFRLSGVRLDKMRPSSCLGHSFRCRGGRCIIAMIAEDHVARLLGESLRDREPDPFRSASDKYCHRAVNPRRE